jgi:ABC-type bacteriocin/lantibiotic exporter with double-glycine peptidase domain
MCLQSTPSSCGAASAASVLKRLGIDATEKEIAKECFTYRGGTENWYIARALRRRGCSVRFRIEDGLPKNARLPVIAGVRVRKFGHFIAILGKFRGDYICADPLVGLEWGSEKEIRSLYHFTGFLMEVKRNSQ